MKAIVEVRSQHQKCRGRNKGPDTYVAVQVVPDGVLPLLQLKRDLAASRGIQIIHCGEEYRLRQKTGRSMLGRAMAEAHRIAGEINGKAS